VRFRSILGWDEKQKERLSFKGCRRRRRRMDKKKGVTIKNESADGR